MCRFTLYLGPSVRLGTLLTDPAHSLIHQSVHARERSEPLNGDGFGVGWYAPRLAAEPALFHSVTPAWNNRNLRGLARVVASPCVLAHVRAASPGSEVDLANCHPFSFGRYLLMHNGSVGAFRRVRRRLLEGVSDEAFNVVRGSTDTEHLFAVFVDELLRAGDPAAAPDPVRALAERLGATIGRVLEAVRDAGEGAPSSLNVAVADGERAAVSRYSDGKPDSLYWMQGELYAPTAKEFPQRRDGELDEAYIVSSERLTEHPAWRAVPPNHIVAFTRGVPARLYAMSREGGLAETDPTGTGTVPAA